MFKFEGSGGGGGGGGRRRGIGARVRGAVGGLFGRLRGGAAAIARRVRR